MNPGPTLPRMRPLQELAAMLNLADTTTRWAALETLARTSRRGDDSWHFLAGRADVQRYPTSNDCTMLQLVDLPEFPNTTGIR